MFMIAPVGQSQLHPMDYDNHTPTAMLDQFTPFWPGSLWMGAMVIYSESVVAGEGITRQDALAVFILASRSCWGYLKAESP